MKSMKKFKLVKRSKGNPFGIDHDLFILGDLIKKSQAGLSNLEKNSSEMEELFCKIGTTTGEAKNRDIRKARRLWERFTESQPTIERLLEISVKYMEILRH